MKEEQKQLKNDFAAYIDAIEVARGETIGENEVKPLAMEFMLERLGKKNEVDCLVRDWYRYHDYEPEPQPTTTEKKTRLCEIAADLEEMRQLYQRVSSAVRQAINEES